MSDPVLLEYDAPGICTHDRKRNEILVRRGLVKSQKHESAPLKASETGAVQSSWLSKTAETCARFRTSATLPILRTACNEKQVLQWMEKTPHPIHP